MNTKDLEILLGLAEILDGHKHYTAEDKRVLNAVKTVFNDAEFERLHPRDKDGKFARIEGGSNPETEAPKEHTTSPEYQETLARVAEDNKRGIKPDEVIDRYVKATGFDGDLLRKRIAEIDAKMDDIRLNEKDTQHKYKIDGVYTEERQKKHLEIISKIFANKENARPKDGEKPTVIFLGGRGGSGKSKFDLPNDKDNKGGVGVYDSNKYIVLDADKIKEELDEYKGYNAAEVHEESSEIMKMALKKAREEKLNIVLDATMKKYQSTKEKIEDFQKDYNIEMYYMHLPREKAAERAIGRFVGKHGKMNGRYVPLHVILNEMKLNEENFDRLKHYASKWAFYNNDVPKQEDKPILIDKNY